MFARHIFILLLFFALIFVISELWDLFDKFTRDFAIKSLLTKDLKIILKYRGIKYKNIFEKQELINLIKETGEVTKYEYESAIKYDENEGQCNLTRVKVIPFEDLFNELVEDSKDSAWILMTISSKSVSISSDRSNKLNDVWCHIQSVYGQYGINMAVLDCELLSNLCRDRGFHRSPFVLVLPRGRVKIKDSVDFFVFPYSFNIFSENINSVKGKIVEWLRMKIAHRINQESHITDFPVHFVSIYSNQSLIEQTPTSISAHSVKFTGRIHFWSGTLNSIPNEFKEKISQTFPNWSPPGHFFINNNDLIYQYGIKEGQSINYEALQLFFRDLCPNSNDAFIWILLAINIIISFHIAMKNISIAFKLGYFILYFIIFNMIYCLIFLFLVSKAFNDFTQFLSFIWQTIAISSFFEHLRYLQFNQKLNFLLCTIVWMLLICIIVYYCKEPEQPEMISNNEILPNIRNFEPWDPEAGQQIALITALGNINLFLEQQPPLYITKLFNWTFQVVNKINNFCDEYSTAGDYKNPGSSAQPLATAESHHNGLQWPHGYIFTKECCICLSNFRQNEMLCGLPCGHAFHDNCIKKWLIEKDDCPQCRWPAYKEKH